MQDRYAGDVGDFGKLSLLRALVGELRLGVCWYRVADESHNADGKHRGYLNQARRYRGLDSAVFDALTPLRDAPARRTVATLQAMGLLPSSTIFHADVVPKSLAARRQWRDDMLRVTKPCDVVFLDPDNGILSTNEPHKQVLEDELAEFLARGQAVLAYHHQTRRKGGAGEEWCALARHMFGIGATVVQAVRLRPGSSRFYVLANGSDALHQRLLTFANNWREKAESFPRVTSIP